MNIYKEKRVQTLLKMKLSLPEIVELNNSEKIGFDEFEILLSDYNRRYQNA